MDLQGTHLECAAERRKPADGELSATRAAPAAAADEAAEMASCGWLAARLTFSNRLSRCRLPPPAPDAAELADPEERRGSGSPLADPVLQY